MTVQELLRIIISMSKEKLKIEYKIGIQKPQSFTNFNISKMNQG